MKNAKRVIIPVVIVLVVISAPAKMLMRMTISRKLVPQRGWKRVQGRTFSTVSSRPDS